MTEKKTTTTRKRATTKKLTNSEKLSELIKEIQNNKTEGVVTLENGQTYTKVDYRLKKAREKFGFDLSVIEFQKDIVASSWNVVFSPIPTSIPKLGIANKAYVAFPFI